VSALQPPPIGSSALLCPRCGSTLREDQSWCLECGLAARTRVHPPPSWRIPIVLTLVLLALLATGIAIALVTLLDTPESTPAPATVTVPAASSSPASTATTTATVPGTPTVPATTAPEATAPAPPSSGALRSFTIPGTRIRLPANATR